MNKEYWVYDPIEGDFMFFDDIDARNEEVDNIIEDCRDYDGMWAEDLLESITCGEGITTHIVEQTNVKMRPDKLDPDGYDEDGFYWPSDWGYICDYKMKEIKP